MSVGVRFSLAESFIDLSFPIEALFPVFNPYYWAPSFSIKVCRQNTSPRARHCWTPSLVSIYLPHLSISISSTPSAVEYNPLHFVHCLQLGSQYITSHKSLRSTSTCLNTTSLNEYGLQNMRPPTISQALVKIMADNGKSNTKSHGPRR